MSRTGINRRCTLLRRAFAAWVRVPAVSTISSTIMATLPLTSPIRCITSEILGPDLRLSIMAREEPSRLAKALARSVPPASGDTMTVVSLTKLLLQILKNNRCSIQVVNGDIEEPLNLSCMQVNRHNPVSPGGGDQVRHQLGGNRSAGATLRS